MTESTVPQPLIMGKLQIKKYTNEFLPSLELKLKARENLLCCPFLLSQCCAQTQAVIFLFTVHTVQ